MEEERQPFDLAAFVANSRSGAVDLIAQVRRESLKALASATFLVVGHLAFRGPGELLEHLDPRLSGAITATILGMEFLAFVMAFRIFRTDSGENLLDDPKGETQCVSDEYRLGSLRFFSIRPSVSTA